MSSTARLCATSADVRVVQLLVISFAVSVGGCSADVTRFDFPAFGLTEKSGSTASIPTPSAPIARRDPGYYDGSPAPRADLGDPDRGYAPAPYSSAPPPYASSPPPYAGGSTPYSGSSAPYASSPPGQYAGAPAPYAGSSGGYPGTRPSYNGSGDRVASVRDVPPPAPAADPAPGGDRYAGRPMDRARAAARGETIQVQDGDTLYGISKRYGVSLSALIEANGLGHGSAIKPGQQLVLPPTGTVAARPAIDTTPGRAPLPRTASPAAPPVATPTPGWEKRHTLKAGESLYGIARQHGVTLAELQRVNGITQPTRVRAGTVLLLPGAAEAGASAAAEPAPSPEREAAPSAPGTPGRPHILNTPETGRKTAALTDRGNDATAPPASEPVVTSGSKHFRWPARGRVIVAFGKRPDGTHNDGINIALPQGTEIHATEGGRVAYAGNELKGYGNLVLIRHDNGWVSAYAHAEEILVKRDDVVKRGQVIAKAGKTGTVDQPQLHFELRQGARPVDPMPHLER